MNKLCTSSKAVMIDPPCLPVFVLAVEAAGLPEEEAKA